MMVFKIVLLVLAACSLTVSSQQQSPDDCIPVTLACESVDSCLWRYSPANAKGNTCGQVGNDLDITTEWTFVNAMGGRWHVRVPRCGKIDFQMLNGLMEGKTRETFEFCEPARMPCWGSRKSWFCEHTIRTPELFETTGHQLRYHGNEVSPD